jgi:hypothetical protein
MKNYGLDLEERSMLQKIPKNLTMEESEIANHKSSISIVKKQQIEQWTEKNPIQQVSLSCIIKAPKQTKLYKSILSEDKLVFLQNSMQKELILSKDEIARDVNLEEFGLFSIAVKAEIIGEKTVFLSMFVGENGTHFEFANERKAAISTSNIIKKILAGKEVLSKNIKLFSLAIAESKIAHKSVEKIKDQEEACHENGIN